MLSVLIRSMSTWMDTKYVNKLLLQQVLCLQTYKHYAWEARDSYTLRPNDEHVYRLQLSTVVLKF